MDQNDREDGNTNTNEETTPTQQQDTSNVTDTESTNIPVRFATSTRTELTPDVATEGNSTEPAEINIIETITISPEIEPATVAFTPIDDTNETPGHVQPPASDNQDKEDSDKPQSDIAPEKVVTPTVSSKDKKRLMLVVAASIILFVVVGVLAWWLLMGSNKDTSSEQSDDMLSSSTEQAKLGVALTVADSTVEYSIDGVQWQTATVTSQLEEGYLIRTGTDSRTVLTLDDGTALRLDANSQVKLVSLSVKNVQIEQTEGSIYSRVVPSDRIYVVTIDGTTYQALGTAFVTVKNEDENGVQVYQSTVRVSDSAEAVTEGKQYYKSNSDEALQGKVTDIDIDTLVDNAFVSWNLSQDENDTNFKEKLGVLSLVKERAATKEAERQAAEQAAKEEETRTVSEKETTESEHAGHSEDVTRGTMTLGLVGKIFSWSYTGKAVHGYKLVYSTKTNTPKLGTNDSIYASETSGELPKKEMIGGGKYYVRVCAYTTNDDKCVDYSNAVMIDI